MRRLSLTFNALLAILVVVTLASCGGGGGSSSQSSATTGNANPTPSPVNTTTFAGTIGGNGGQTGTMSVTVDTTVAAASRGFELVGRAEAQTSDSIAANGSYTFVGQTAIGLTGTYTPTSGALALNDGNGTSFTGSITSAGAVSGTFNNASTGLSGAFELLSGTSTNYCGTFTSNPDTGVFNVTVSSSGVLEGEATPTNDNSPSVTLSGSVSGNTFSGTSSQGYQFQGTIQGSLISGTISNNGGTFTGASGNCQ